MVDQPAVDHLVLNLSCFIVDWCLFMTCARSDDPHKRRPDISVAKEQLGWSPQVPVREGLSKTIDYFRKELEDTGKPPMRSMRNMLLTSYLCIPHTEDTEAKRQPHVHFTQILPHIIARTRQTDNGFCVVFLNGRGDHPHRPRCCEA